MKKLLTIVKRWSEYINQYTFHYRKFGKGGLALLNQTRKQHQKIIEFYIKELAHPLYLRNNTSDLLAFYQIFSFKQYKLKRKVNPKFIIDCGANVGYSSVYFSSVYPNATIIAVEPESSNFEILLKNAAPYPNIKCIKSGIWNKAAFLEITDAGSDKWAFTTKAVENENENTIKAIAIGDILDEYNVDFIDILKIDIEGSEKEMFEENYEKWLSRTRIIIIELHDRIKKGCSKTFFKAAVNYDFSLEHKGENLIFTFNN